MKTNTKHLSTAGRARHAVQGKKTFPKMVPVFACILLLLCTVLSFSIFSVSESLASDQSNIKTYENLDARWLPWIGSWRLVSDDEETADSALKDQYLLTISPDESGKSIIMKGYRDEQVLLEEEIEADGLRRPLKKDDCTGWQSYAWSETGKRLLFSGESSCRGDLSQQVSGMSIIDGSGDWLDIQLLQSEEEKAITIRRYRNVDPDTIAPGRTSADRARIARLTTGTGFSIDEIIELSGKVEPEVLEAALVEMHKPFPINSKQILRLADAKVSTRVVDLMVALSFPDKFIVEQAVISRVQEPAFRQVPPGFRPFGCRWHCYHPRFPWYWAGSIYSCYDYWYLDRHYWPGWNYYGWWYPGYGGGGYGVKTGRLVKGRGYTRVYSEGSEPAQLRYARPRNAMAAQGARSGPQGGSSTATSSSTSSNRSSNVSTPVNRSSSPSASPSGYSSGSSSGSTTEQDSY